MSLERPVELESEDVLEAGRGRGCVRSEGLRSQPEGAASGQSWNNLNNNINNDSMEL